MRTFPAMGWSDTSVYRSGRGAVSILKMNSPKWTDIVVAFSSALTPLVVAVLAYVLTRNQSRSEELLRARIDYYRVLVPDLNRLMCYMTFIGGWRDLSPPDILTLKRRLDENFNYAAPLFSKKVSQAYQELMDDTFVTFGRWGQDARIKSNPFRRRVAWQGKGKDEWQPEWEDYFTMPESSPISGESLQQYRGKYDTLIAAAVGDLDLTRARARYTTDLVAMNANAPPIPDIPGSGG